jgi:hypothetical protein
MLTLLLVPKHGATVVVDDLGTVGAAEARHAAGALGEEERRLVRGGVPRRLRCRKRDKLGAEALGDSVVARA